MVAKKRRKKSKKNINIEFIPFERLRNMSLSKQVKYIIKKTKENKILVFDSKLTPEEEAKLISETMKHINKRFSGIEICSLYADKETGFLNKLKDLFFKTLTGKSRGTSIIGPAKVIKEIKRDPESISILMK